MESTNNSLIVTDINITNNTYVIISPANITGYTNVCTSYQWGIRAAADISCGFTGITIANETFIFNSSNLSLNFILFLLIFLDDIQCHSVSVSSPSSVSTDIHLMLSESITADLASSSSKILFIFLYFHCFLVFITRSKSRFTIQPSMDCTAVIITSTVKSTVYNTVTVTPSTNVIPIVIGTTVTIMILLIVVIILLIFTILLCYKMVIYY